MLHRSHFHIFVAAVATAIPFLTKAQLYKDINASPQERAESIVAEMTLEEKVSLMQNFSPAISRLGIKQYDWWNEALHGVGRAGLATVFPQPIGMAASFDDKLVFDVFTAVSDEARAKNTALHGNSDLHRYQGLTFWTPNINIFRDPRWGRGHETYGEDPYLTSKMGLSVVRGLQGDNFEGTFYTGPDAPRYYKLHACAKHYAVHSGPEWSRHAINVNYISPRDLWETYLPAFKALVIDGNVKEVMCAYNRYDDEPCCGSTKLLGTILRHGWGYQGIVLSDCWAINDFYTPGHHFTEPDAQHAAATALRTGTDLECGETYANLVEAVQQGLVEEATIDASLVRLMTARYELGEMDADSLVSWTQITYSVVDSEQHKALAMEMAKKSLVLLKNDGVLPLKPGLKIGVLGPNANDSVMQWGNYNGFPSHTATLLSALRQRLPDCQIAFVDGLDHVASTNLKSLVGQTLTPSGKKGFDAAFRNNMIDVNQARSIIDSPDVRAHFDNSLAINTAGATVAAPGVDLGRFTGVFTTTFIPDETANVAFSIQTQGYAAMMIDGVPVFYGGNMKNANAYTREFEAGKEYEIMLAYAATEGDCASLYFDFGIPMPIDTERVPRQLEDCDVVIYASGLSPNLEGEEMPVQIPGFRGGDRETIELPAVQTEMMRAIRDAGKPLIVVNFSGSAVVLDETDAPANAIMQAWYPGQAGGDAIAGALFGDYSPAGRLPVTFYKSTADLPDIEDYNMIGHTYRYFKGEPLYPFGYGLSYANFEYGEAKATTLDDNILVTVPVRNASDIDAEEVVQLYLSRPDDPAGPIRQLRGYKRELIPAQTETIVDFLLTPKELEWYDADIEDMRAMQDGFNISVGPSSDPASLRHVLWQ